ncbi:uncharacterized protein LOC128727181 [Anopheles nili]|uniref:uncharacterized protein LOC128727181 n=1 Tax=Anopheles nili TaxID=185578 RepID=UPI00237ABB48|nr:uncharacterized protein LOC128727181 [Anopheles nili]
MFVVLFSLLLVSLELVAPSLAVRPLDTDDNSRSNAPKYLSIVSGHWMCAGHNAPVFFAHDTDCSRYYECVCEDAYEYACDAGTRFNPQTLHCDREGRVACLMDQGHRQVSQDLPVAHRNPWAPRGDVETTGAPQEPAIDPRCPSVQSDKSWSDETNCSKHYRCVDGQVKELYCVEQLVWDNAVQECRLPNPDKCCAAVPPAPILKQESSSLWNRLQVWMG